MFNTEIHRSQRPLPFRVAVCVLFLASAAATPAAAQTGGSATWSNAAVSGEWSNAANWTSGTAPTTSGTWNLSFGGTTQTSGTNTIGTITIGTLSFTNNGTVGRTASFTQSGSTLALSTSTITTTATTAGSIAGDLISNALTVTGSNAIQLGSGHSLGLAGNVTGAGSVNVSGASVLYVSGSNSYSGGTLVTSGQVRTASIGGADASNNNAFGSGGVVVSGSGSVALRNGTTLANNFLIGGAGVYGSGTQGALRGSFSTNGRTSTISGSVALSANATITTAASGGITGGQFAVTGPVTLGSSVLTLAPDLGSTNGTATSIVLSGGVSGVGSVVVSGSFQSRVTMSGSSSYTGGTTLSSGSLTVGNASALGTGPLSVLGGVLDLNGQSLSVGSLTGSSAAVITSSVAGAASLNVNQTTNKDFASVITDGAGVVSLSKSGSGLLYFSGSNSYSGGTTVTGGQIRTAANGVLDGSNNNAFGTGVVTVSGSGSVALRNATTLANDFTIAGQGLSSSGTQGAIRGSFSTSNRTASVTGAVTLSADATIATAANVGVTGSRLLLSGPVNLAAHTLTLSPDLSGGPLGQQLPIIITGTVNGTGNVIVDGSGGVFVNGANTSTGSTTVRAGVLGGDGAITGAVVVQAGAIIAPGDDLSTTGVLSVGSLQLDAGATAAMAISGTGTGLFDQIIAAGNVSYGGMLAIDFTTAGFANFDSWQLFEGGSHSGHFDSVAATGSFGNLTFNYLGDGEWQATGGLLEEGQSLSFYEDNSHAIGGRYVAGQLVLVPEPSTLAFAGIGLFVAGWRGWMRRRSSVRSARVC